SPCTTPCPRRRSSGVVDGERRVVGKALYGFDRTGAQAVAQRRRHELVIDAPTDDVGSRGATVAPPGVVLAFGVQVAVGVDPAGVVAKPVEPVALGRQASGVLLVGLPVADVELAAYDVPVTA